MNDRYFPKADIQFSIIEFLVERLPREQDVLEAHTIAARKMRGSCPECARAVSRYYAKSEKRAETLT